MDWDISVCISNCFGSSNTWETALRAIIVCLYMLGLGLVGALMGV